MSGQIAGFGTLFSSTWKKYKARALPILGVMLLTAILIVGICLLFALGAMFFGWFSLNNTGNQPLSMLVVGAVLILSCGVTILCMWSQTAVTSMVVDDSLGVMDGLRKGWRLIWSMAWITLLVGGIVMVGFMLIIPGLFFLVWFGFAIYILIDEDKRGLDALLASREYVRGYGWNTFFKLFVVLLLSVALNVIPLVGPLLFMLYNPFLMLFMVAIYKNLKEIKGDSAGAAPAGRGLWGAVAGLGMATPLIMVLIGLIAASSSGLNIKTVVEMMRLGGSISCPSPMAKQSVPSRQPASQKQRKLAAVEPTDGKIVDPDSRNNPTGGGKQVGMSRWFDIQEVSAVGANGVLLLTIMLDNPLAAFYDEADLDHTLGRLISFYLDIDGTRETGSEVPDGSGRQGYDVAIDLILEAKVENPKLRTTHASLHRLNGARISSMGRLEKNQLAVEERRIQLSIPYQTIGLKAGKQLRLCYREISQEQGGGLAEEKLVNLR